MYLIPIKISLKISTSATWIGTNSVLQTFMVLNSLGTRQICELMFYLLWQMGLVPLPFKLISLQPGPGRVSHSRLSNSGRVSEDDLTSCDAFALPKISNDVIFGSSHGHNVELKGSLIKRSAF